MKHRITIYPLLFVGLLIASCNDYISHPTPEEEREAEPRTLTLILPTGKATTRGDLAGLANEKYIDTLAVYMFDSHEQTFEEGFIIPASQLTSGSAAGSQKAIVTLEPDVSGAKHFYVLANVQGVTTNKVGNLPLGVGNTTEDQFVNALQSLKDGHLQYKGDKIALPMYGTDDQGNEYLTVPDATNLAPKYSIELVRSVARFDIVNDKTTSHFEVTEVGISGAKKDGKAYPSTTVFEQANAMKDAFKISGLTAAANKTATKADSQPEFYLLPTQLNDNTTQIWLNGIYTSADGKVVENRMVQVIPPASTPPQPTDDDIIKNRLYMIVVDCSTNPAQSDTIKASLLVASWDERNTLDAYDRNQMSIIDDKVDIVDATDTHYTQGSNGAPDVYTNYKLDMTNLPKFKFKAKAQSADFRYTSTCGAQYTFVGSGWSDLITDPYPHYEVDVTITVPATSPIPLDHDTLTIRDGEGRALHKMVFTLAYPYNSTTFYPLPDKTGLWWAPMNAGATTDAMQQSDCNYYQWGRTHAPIAKASSTALTTVAGPVTWDVANGGADKFYTGDTDWLTPARNGLWNGFDAQGPCPAGWRLPTAAEYQGLQASLTQAAPATDGTSFTRADLNVDTKIQLGSGAGYIDGANGTVDKTDDLYLWTSTIDGGKAKCMTVESASATQSTISIASVSRASAMAVRCVYSR